MKKTSHKTHKANKLKMSAIIAGIFLAGFLIGNIGIFNKDTACQANVAGTTVTDTKTPADTAATPQTDQTNATTTEKTIILKSTDIMDTTTTPYLGSAKAPVTMIEFTDYQCPYCQQYYFGAFQKIKEAYIKTGKIKYEIKSFPLSFHPEARPASYATHCALEQNALWPMHKKLFTLQNEWVYADDSNQKFVQYAYEIGLDTNKFQTCLNNGKKKYDSVIDSDMSLASGYKITGTPSFLINGKPLIGVRPFESFAQAIEEAMKTPSPALK